MRGTGTSSMYFNVSYVGWKNSISDRQNTNLPIILPLLHKIMNLAGLGYRTVSIETVSYFVFLRG